MAGGDEADLDLADGDGLAVLDRAAVLVAVVGMQFIGRGDGDSSRSGESKEVASIPLRSNPIIPQLQSTDTPEVPERQVVATITGMSGVKWDMPDSGPRQLLAQCAVGDRLKLVEERLGALRDRD